MSEHTTEESYAVYQPIAGHYCGQVQPHSAHVWHSPPVYGAATVTSVFQCAGYITLGGEPNE